MPRKQTKKDTASAAPSDLTETEQDLLSHMQNGYQLETNSLGREPLLRHMEDKQVIRPLSATQNTVKALEERGLIVPAKGAEGLSVTWRLSKNTRTTKSRT
jgi:hypothetical protein